MGDLKGLVEQYCAIIQKDMIHITHLALLLIDGQYKQPL